MDFKEWLHLHEDNVPGYHLDGNTTQTGGGIVSSDQSGSETTDTHDYLGHDVSTGGTDEILPLTRIQGTIVGPVTKYQELNDRQNPILIYVKEPRYTDYTILSFTPAEYRRIRGTVELGRTIVAELQRHPGDLRRRYSQVQSATVF